METELGWVNEATMLERRTRAYWALEDCFMVCCKQ